MAAGGVALAAWAVARFRRAGTSPLPHRAATAMVAAGPYRLTRNPMYLGMTAVLAGAGLALARGWIVLSAFVAAFLVDRAVIAREERYLERAFGDDYRAYKRRVRRWL